MSGQDFCSSDPCSPASCPSPDVCLTTISEGQLNAWCAIPCNGNAECPSGLDCEHTVLSCGSSADCAFDQGIGSCPQCNCQLWQVVNSPPEQFCTDPASAGGQVHEFQKFCAPLSGFCGLHGP
jgi:hypothetical protein